ncbi:hypothetical protein SAMN04488065_0561 [Haloplanus vescus]|uniref:Uncharacterized protein n=1 Tax=Haloplanus vescus TaxID=555874 RepID=A0A1H3W4I4_9EURY|nr:hypothetical protein SAMN04488065_0561 [Haloplanus vescus]
MDLLHLLVGIGSALLGVAYILVPNWLYHFGLDSLRDTQSAPSEPSDLLLWTFRFIGVCLVIVSVAYVV